MKELWGAIICHDDSTYLSAVLKSVAPLPAVVFVNRIPWGENQPGDWQATKRIALECGAEVIEGEWAEESDHRRAVLQWAREQGVRGLVIPDSDEVLSPQLLETIRRIHSAEIADVVYCTMDTYWKSPEYVIRPRERLMPAIYLAPQSVQHRYIRDFSGLRPLMISEEHGLLHHLSYAGPPERILRKISTWSHRNEVVPNWLAEKWDAWDGDRSLTDLHPTHPFAYQKVERGRITEELVAAWECYIAASGGSDPLHPPIPPLAHLPNVSVIIPLYGGPEDIELCLKSLEAVQDLLEEVLVIDDCSPDDAPSVVADFPFARLIKNAENQGFAASCNRGADESSGEILLFLNSDTIVPRHGLVELIRCIQRSGTIGAVGPMSNAVGHFQLTAPRYSTVDGIELFADDYARKASQDLDTDMLVGFCLAVRRSAWDEVGGFDPTFRVGMFEDNDFSYRLRRAGYRLQIASKAFVHHRGSASLDRHETHIGELFHENMARFEAKWRDDIDLGFVSHLSGLSEQRIRFNESRRPERVWEEIAQLKERAKVSLCMIVRDEERVLSECLNSVKPFFSEIVVVDTGSKDATVQIAKEAGSFVHEMEWPESFSEARNASLQHARGNWICWMDADDTLPPSSGEQILRAALSAPPEIGGFVFPVRFVTDDPSFGTVVDHVKLFRNDPRIRFEGRIHEQVLPSIRAAGYDVMRLTAEVLHTGYDTSANGQAKKRKRDDTLLNLELQDRPGHPFVLFNLGMTAHYNGDHEAAISWLGQCLEASRPEESHVRKAYALLAVSHREQGDWSTARCLCEQGLRAVGPDPELLFHFAILEAAEGRLMESASLYQEVLSLGRGDYLGSVDQGIFGFKSHHNLAGIYRQLGNIRLAHEHYMTAFTQNPRHLPSLIEAFEVHMEIRDRRGAEFVRDTAIRRGAPSELIESFTVALRELG